MRLFLLFCAISALLATASADAATLTVMSGADAGGTCPGATCTLRQAIGDAAVAGGDTIVFAANVTAVDLTSGALVVDKSVTIKGNGADVLTVRRGVAAGNAEFRIFQFNSGTSTLSGVTVANGNPASGGAGISKGAGTLTISDCIISGNNADNGQSLGGGVLNGAGTMTIVNSTLTGNAAFAGAAAYNGAGGVLNVVSSTLSGNTATGSGGGITNVAITNVINSTITNNHVLFTGSSGVGGGIYTTDVVNAVNSIIALNTAGTGQDFYAQPVTAGILMSQGFNIIGNAGGSMTVGTGDQYGITAGQLQLGPLQHNGGTTMTHALLSGSVAIEAGNSGSAATDQRGFARPVDSPAIPNAAGGNGGDIGAYEVQPDLLPGCTNINRIVTNGNDSGADSLRDVLSNVCAGSTITFAPNVTVVTLTTAELPITKGLTITGPGANLLSVQRSAAVGTPNFRIFNLSSNISVTLSGLSVTNGNTSTSSGGGIRNAGTLALKSVALAGNAATLGGNGGVIFNNFGTLTITDSTISGNSVSSTIAASGGGIFNSGGGVTIVNSTLSGNSAVGPGGNSDSGGGIFSNVGTVALVNSTIAGNSGDLGGGVRGLNGAVITARNTIIALNTSGNGPDVNGPLTSQGFNLIGNTTLMTIAPAQFSDQLGVSAIQLNLGPLQFNGGTTQTHALLAGSFARDKGHASGYAADQRGRIRPADLGSVVNAAGGDGSDIGAFEFSDLSIDIDGDGNYDPLTDGLLIIRYLFGLTGNALTSNAIGTLPARSTPQEILQYLDSIRPALDVDGNTQADALTDGMMLIRYLFGLRGPALTAGAIGSNPGRTEAAMGPYIQSLMP